MHEGGGGYAPDFTVLKLSLDLVYWNVYSLSSGYEYPKFYSVNNATNYMNMNCYEKANFSDDEPEHVPPMPRFGIRKSPRSNESVEIRASWQSKNILKLKLNLHNQTLPSLGGYDFSKSWERC